MCGDPVSPPNGTAPQWSEIDDCYVDEPLFIPSWENEMQSSSLGEDSPPPVMIPPCRPDITIDQIEQMDQIDDMLNDIKNREYMEEYAGKRLVHSPRCIHKAKHTPENSSNQKFGRMNKDVDDATYKYLGWIARGHIVPQLCLACIGECNNNGPCGTRADWVLYSGASRHYTGHMSDFSSYEKIHENAFVTLQLKKFAL